MSVPDILRAERGDGIGPIRFMAAADNYVMARRPGCVPFVEPMADWIKRPLERTAGPDRERYRKAFATPSNQEEQP